jgi:V8-like Glu-specific endopeptidase/N-acetyl-anhydromuramyl-L-alanine amidase AmpD/uncharacterized protein YycO
MPGLIRSNSAEVSQRRPMAGFTVRTGGQPFFEVAVAASPDLFRPDARARRTGANFWSSRAAGPLRAERGEAVYMLPTDVLARFAGQERLFYAVATFADSTRANPDVRIPAPEVAPSLVISRTFTGRPTRSLVGVSTRPSGGGYGSPGGDAGSLEWAGDSLRAAAPGQPAAPSGTAPSAPASPSAPAPSANGGQGAPAQSAALGYDDGFDPHLWARPLEEEPAADEADGYGVDGPVPDDGEPAVSTAGYAAAASAPSPEYPQASRFVPANAGNFSVGSGTRAISRIVIHITDGGRNINGTISWFQDPRAKASAHYVVGQDGEVVQMVRHNDRAWHAHTANRDSIGIEHVASRQRNIFPTDDEYRASAALVQWLAAQYGIPLDRQHVLGHAEADTHTTHTGCPTSAWDWDRYWAFVVPPAQPTNAPGAPAQGQSYAASYGGSRVPVPSLYGGNGNGAVSRGLAVVQNAYNPTSAIDALRTQLDFQRRFAQWSAGVTDTSFFPHSAICQLQIRFPGGSGIGTGFYIAPDRILTAAHCVVDWGSGQVQAQSIRVVPGKNGGAEPFGGYNVGPADWAFHPQYDGTRSFDLAVIRTSTPPPGGAYFDVLEELNQSLPSSIVVCGHAAVTVDPDRQHLDGDQVRSLGADGETLQYNLQTEGGTSGSPVYYLWGREDEAQQATVIETRIVGVHVSGFSGTLNQGCRLTQRKIAWIRAQFTPNAAASYGLAYGQPTGRYSPPSRIPARMLGGAVDFNWDDAQLVGQSTANTCWAAASSMIVGWRDQQSVTPRDAADRGGFLAKYDADQGLAASERTALASALGLEQEPGMNFTIDAFADLIATKGPLWVAERTPYGGNHIVVITGIVTDGNPDGSGTNIRVLDPLGRAPGSPATIGVPMGPIGGSRYLVPWNNFVTMYENRISTTGGGVDGQILHATGNGGRTPASGSQFSWSYSLAARALEEIPLDPGMGGQSIGESALMAGDIIVSTTSAVVSAAIRAVSGSPVSHAGLYTGSGTVIEAIGDGVVERPIADSLAGSSVAVAFRVPGLGAAQAQQAVEYALSQVGRGFNYFGIVRQAAYRYHSSYCRLLPDSMQDACRTAVARVDLGTSDGNRFFCSQLVVASFQAAGVPITATDPSWSSPGDVADLRLSSTLEYVGHLKAPPRPTGSSLSYSRPLSLSGFGQGDVDTLKNTFVNNAAGGSQQNCITIVNAALRAMYGSRLQNPDGTNKSLGSRIDTTMASLQGYGLAGTQQVFEFLDASNRLTKGVVRPDHLRDSVEGWMNAQGDAAAQSTWYLFGLSIMDGYHSVVLGFQFSGPGSADTKVYWADQIYTGWDEVTGGLDARITTLTQRWWDRANAATPGRVPRTRATLWPLNP